MFLCWTWPFTFCSLTLTLNCVSALSYTLVLPSASNQALVIHLGPVETRAAGKKNNHED